MRTHRKFTEAFKREAVERLSAGSVSEVAEACGVSVSVLHRWRKQLGVHQTVAPANRRRFSKEFKEAAVRRLEQGETVSEIVSALELDPTVLRRWWHEWRRFGETAFSGYGKQRSPSGSSRIVTLRFTQDEFDRVQAVSLASRAGSLPDFVRTQIIPAAPAPSITEIAHRLEVLITQVRTAVPRSKTRETATPATITTMQPTTLYQR